MTAIAEIRGAALHRLAAHLRASPTLAPTAMPIPPASTMDSGTHRTTRPARRARLEFVAPTSSRAWVTGAMNR